LRTTVQIPVDDVELQLHGDAIIEFVSLFEGLFQTRVVDTIVTQVEDVLENQLGPELNKIAVATNGETDLFEGISLDWSMVKAPQLTTYDFSIGGRGLFYANGSTPVEPNATAPVMPYRDVLNEDRAQFCLSTYTMDSLAYTFLNTVGFNFLLTNDDLPPTIPI